MKADFTLYKHISSLSPGNKLGNNEPGWLREYIVHLRYIWRKKMDGPERSPLEGVRANAARMRHQPPAAMPHEPTEATWPERAGAWRLLWP